MTPFRPDPAFAAQLDAQDPLADYRSRFHIPRGDDGAELVYLCGNSLGLQPRSVRAYVGRELDAWERYAVEGHFHGPEPWVSYHELLTDSTARLVGALPSEVVVMNTLTVNLHLLMVSFYRPTTERHAIVMEARPFPSDRYAAASQIRFHGHDPATALLEVAPRPGEEVIREEDVEDLLHRRGQSVALLLLGGVNYSTGQAFDIERLTRAARAVGCVVGVDLAHAAGNVPLRLHDWDVDFAVWCSYKYLNAGPGSTAGCFVHERHAREPTLPRFAGWWGSDKETRFRMGPQFAPLPGAEGWQVSNPAILPLAALRASMEIFDEVGMERLRAKSERLTGYLAYLLDQLPAHRFARITPEDPTRRGAQLSLLVPRGGRAVFERLERAGIVCDWREPGIIRVAPVPLYNTFTDVHRFAQVFREALDEV